MKRILSSLAAAGLCLLASVQTSDACTGITLKSLDGNTTVARTIEWAGEDNHGRYVVVPRGHVWHSFVPGGGTGRSFKAKYGYVGISVAQDEFMVDGLNEKGLAAGLFYFPDYGKYEDYNPACRESNISDFQLVPYVLGLCSTVEEVKAEIARVHVHGFDPRSSTVHWRFADRSGRQIVLEIIDGRCVFYENTLGVLTNSPSFDWHMTNLNNYVNLAPGKADPQEIGSMMLKSFGGGSGFLGLPGDATPPSRFVRAAFYQCTSRPKQTSSESVMEAFRILSAFNIPVGIQYPMDQTPSDIPSATQFTCASDISGQKFYYRSMWNSEIRCIDLSDIDFAKVKLTAAPLDTVKSDPVHYIKIR